MKKKWINRNGNDACILFFNGWGMDENAVKNMNSNGYDILSFYSYNQLSALQTEHLQYNEIYVVAWSLGVSVANMILNNAEIDIKSAIAINGTAFPMHHEYGIPESVFMNTLKNWDHRNSKKFNLRMVGGKTRLDAAAGLMSNRDLKEQQEELQFFYDNIEVFKPVSMKWEAAFVGENDQIIPTQNQINYWKDKTNIVKTPWAHFPFTEVNSWQSLIDITKNNGKG